MEFYAKSSDCCLEVKVLVKAQFVKQIPYELQKPIEIEVGMLVHHFQAYVYIFICVIVGDS